MAYKRLGVSYAMQLKKLIRRLSLKLSSITSSWVVSTDMYKLIDEDDFDSADKALDEQTKIWGSDPEITRARSLIQFYR